MGFDYLQSKLKHLHYKQAYLTKKFPIVFDKNNYPAIYKITWFSKEKNQICKYIGLASSIDRSYSHIKLGTFVSKNSKHEDLAIEKHYQEDTFTWSLLERNIELEELKACESKWIEIFKERQEKDNFYLSNLMENIDNMRNKQESIKSSKVNKCIEYINKRANLCINREIGNICIQVKDWKNRKADIVELDRLIKYLNIG
jgi:uncharacterized FlaG/YvyC family protein